MRLGSAGRAIQSGPYRVVKSTVARRTVSLACHHPFGSIGSHVVSLSLNDVFRPTSSFGSHVVSLSLNDVFRPISYLPFAITPHPDVYFFLCSLVSFTLPTTFG
jgi:hypothetical protein